MTEPSAARLPLRGRLFVYAVSVCGIAVAAWCVATVARTNVPRVWLLFAGLTIASGTFTLKIPSIESRLSVSELFAFTCILLFGPAAGALTLSLDGIFISLRCRMSVQKTIFNFGNLGLSTWLCGVVFFKVSGAEPLYQHAAAYATLIVPLGLMTLTYFTVNSGLTAVAVASEMRKPFVAVWREHFMPLVPSYLAGASVALLLVVALREVHFSAIALILPLLLISYLTLRSSFGRLEDSKAHVLQLNRQCLSTVETLATAIDAKDEVTHDHIRRVQAGTLALAREMGVRDVTMLQALEAAALLHDTGKIAVPEHILNKPGKLTPAEFEKMKLHAPIGAEILSSIEFPYPVVPIVRHHHESWDGTGYPDGLSGSDIPLGARILSVVDCFDALTSDRPYRRALSDGQALAILRERRGQMYDPLVVDTFLAAYGRIMPAPNAVLHPAAMVISSMRTAAAKEATEAPAAPPVDAPVRDEMLAMSSLARAFAGDADVSDLGALAWMLLRPLVPCSAMALFVPDEQHDAVVVRYAAGAHAPLLRGVSRPTGSGVTGWVAVNRRPAVNADPAVDLGVHAVPALAAMLAVPLVHSDRLVAVLALYAEEPGAFTEDQSRLLELMTPRLAASLAALTEAEAAGAAGLPRPRRGAAPDLRLVKAGS